MHLLSWEYRLGVVFARLSWTTASRHSVVVQHHYQRARPANRSQQIMAAVWTIPSECIVFLSLRRTRTYYTSACRYAAAQTWMNILRRLEYSDIGKMVGKLAVRAACPGNLCTDTRYSPAERRLERLSGGLERPELDAWPVELSRRTPPFTWHL
jgi:hypothetical protein